MGEWAKPRTVFAAMFYATFIYLILKGAAIPDLLNSIVSTLFGYWYGSRNAQKS